MDFFYDQQIRRLILQVNRIFGGFVVQTGLDRNGQKQFRQVLVRYGETSRMVNQIIRELTENKVLSTPFMSTSIVSINMAPDRRQNLFLVSTHFVDEREFDVEKNEYTGNRGDRFTFKRHMPVPYNFTIQLDIWTSNVDQKMQLTEQIMMLFNPSQKLQSSDNPLDWTAITDIEMQDSITWTSKSQPVGTDEAIDISSMQFLIPYWINPPAELTKRRAIETIINNVRAVQELPADDTDFAWESGELLFQQIFTPDCHILQVDGNNLTLLNSESGLFDEGGDVQSWKALIFLFGEFCEGETQITVKRKFGDPNGITGVISFTGESNTLTWIIDPDTLPANTLSDINAIIDPQTVFPQPATEPPFDDTGLPTASTGQRYLLAGNIGGTTIGWGSLTAEINDIVEFDGTDWNVVFDSATETVAEVVRNSFTDKQFRWNSEKQDWEPVVDGKYSPGTWKVILRDDH